MGLMTDVFNDDLFGFVDLTASINKEPFAPGLITSMGVFDEEGVTQRNVLVEEEDGTLSLLQTQVPYEQVNRLDAPRRVGRNFMIPHIPVGGRIYARQLSGVREFGQESVARQVSRERDKEIAKQGRSLDVTEEYHRLGAVKGMVLDADGSTIHDLFTEFGVTQEPEIGFNLGAATDQELWADIDLILMTMQDNLQGQPLNNIVALCGTTFFTQLTHHAAVTTAYERWSQLAESMRINNAQSAQPGDFLRASYVYKSFAYRNINWVHYQGAVNGTQFVADDKAHFFPQGIPGLFISRYAPSDLYLDTVNTEGIPRYSKATLDTKERWIDLDSEMNGLHLCTQPAVLMQGRAGA